MKATSVLIGLLALVVSACSGANPASPSSPIGATLGSSAQLSALTEAPSCGPWEKQGPAKPIANPNNGKVDISNEFERSATRYETGAEMNYNGRPVPAGVIQSPTQYDTFKPSIDGQFRFRARWVSNCASAWSDWSDWVSVSDVEVDRNVKPKHPNNGR